MFTIVSKIFHIFRNNLRGGLQIFTAYGRSGVFTGGGMGG